MGSRVSFSANTRAVVANAVLSASCIAKTLDALVSSPSIEANAFGVLTDPVAPTIKFTFLLRAVGASPLRVAQTSLKV